MDYVHPDKLEAAAKWAAGGFTVLLSLLLFFGVKEGVLDQALRLNPLATMCVVVLLGAGLLAALFAPAIDPKLRLRLWAVLAVIAAMMLIAALYFPNVVPLEGSVEGQGWSAWEIVAWTSGGLAALAGALAIPIWVSWWSEEEKTSWARKGYWVAWSSAALAVTVGLIYLGTRVTLQNTLTVALALLFCALITWAFVACAGISAGAAVIVLGVVATSLGLYGAAKLSVDSKTLAVDPTLTAALVTYEDTPAIGIHAQASRLRGQHMRVEVYGLPRLDMTEPPDAPISDSLNDAEVEHVWSSILQPNALDAVDSRINVPFIPARWEEIYVSHCVVGPGQAEECARNGSARNVLTVSNPRRGMELTGHIVAGADSNMEVTLKGIAVAPGTRIKAEVCRVGSGKSPSPLAVATLAPDGQGELVWTPKVPPGKDGDALVLLYAACRPGLPCPEDMTELARYTLP